MSFPSKTLKWTVGLAAGLVLSAIGFLAALLAEAALASFRRLRGARPAEDHLPVAGPLAGLRELLGAYWGAWATY